MDERNYAGANLATCAPQMPINGILGNCLNELQMAHETLDHLLGSRPDKPAGPVPVPNGALYEARDMAERISSRLADLNSRLGRMAGDIR